MNSNRVKFYPVELSGKIRVLPGNYPNSKSGYIPENYPELKKKNWNTFYPGFTRNLPEKILECFLPDFYPDKLYIPKYFLIMTKKKLIF